MFYPYKETGTEFLSQWIALDPHFIHTETEEQEDEVISPN